MTVTPKYNKHQTYLADLVSCALEGGINYWAIARKYRWCGVNSDGTPWLTKPEQVENLDTDGTANSFAEVADREDDWAWDNASEEERENGDVDEPIWYRIDKTTITKGIEAMIADGYFSTTYTPENGWKQDHSRLWASILTDGDDGDYDSIDADNIVQYGLFGKIVYG